MTETNRTKRKSNSWDKVIGLMITAVLMIFVCGHLSAVIQQGNEILVLPYKFLEHMQTEPFDFFHKNGYVIYFAVCIYALIFFTTFSKRELPKAEMKGMEHGSNDFQTQDERIRFLADNTSPIYSFDLQEFDIEKSGKDIRSRRRKYGENQKANRSGKSSPQNWKRKQPAVKSKCKNQL